MASNIIWDIQLIDMFTGKALTDTGGICFVAKQNLPEKATLLNPDAQMAPLANPVAPIRGKIRFAIAQLGEGQAAPPAVDVYGITALGHAFMMRGILPGYPTEFRVNANTRQETVVIPFSFVDCTPGTEQDTSFVLPTNTLVDPSVSIRVTALNAGKTVNAGLLSSQAGGNAAGFLNGGSLAAATRVKATINGASPTLGSFVSIASGAGATLVPEAYVVGSTAINVSYTLAAGTTTGEGFIELSYVLPPY
jgi:hypothetical protein